MPKSKRDKKVSLTKTDKKGLALKQRIVEDVRNCVEKYKSIYIFSVHNMRNDKMQQLRRRWKPSKFFFGKNKVLCIAFGKNKESEVETDIHKLGTCLKGQCGLLFTDKPKDYVLKWFKDFGVEDFARAGFESKTKIVIPAGPLPEFSHAMEPYLRQLGLPTSLERGVVTLLKDYEVCKEQSILTPEQAKILKLFGNKLAMFRLVLKGAWIKGKGFERLEDNIEMEEDKDDEMDTEKMEDEEIEENND